MGYRFTRVRKQWVLVPGKQLDSSGVQEAGLPSIPWGILMTPTWEAGRLPNLISPGNTPPLFIGGFQFLGGQDLLERSKQCLLLGGLPQRAATTCRDPCTTPQLQVTNTGR